jgi:diguanylate cyclase (GGDEF)-like protein/PAS domain S-box-containing protein
LTDSSAQPAGSRRGPVAGATAGHAVRLAGAAPDTSRVKRSNGGRRFLGASAVVFAAGPVAAFAVLWLQRAHLISATPLWLLIALLGACSISNGIVIAVEGRLTPFWGLQLRSAVAAISTAWVVYATGWGSLLVIAYAIAIADAMRVHGSRAWRPGLVWSMVAVFGGEVAIELGLAPSIMQPSTSHALAGATTCCLALIVRTLGVSAKAAEDAAVRIEEGRSYFRDLVQHAADVIALVSENLRIEYVSPGIESMVGCTAAACIGLQIREVLGTDASADIARAHETLTLSDYVSCEWRLTNELRGQRQVYARLTLRHDKSLVLNLRDVTEQRALEAQLQHRANVDQLTGLPNRAALIQQLSQRERVDVTVLFIDLDGFKEVNDSLGHEQGDRVLSDVASRIASAVRTGVTVGRLGGDEFLAIMQGAHTLAAQVVAERIIAGIVQVGSVTKFPLSASVGIATGTPDESAEKILRRADHAMYQAKAAGPGRIRVAPLEQDAATPSL